ncbi:MAG TPA: 50S ribosomal protein L9 [Planctomycetes bacterium]|nr:50S ribosomal protein L9 [Planctomycetota bacterium]
MAKRTEVLLVKDVLKLGNMGDVVRVPPGYARNFLYPYGLAIHADGAAKRQIEVLREKAAKNETEREAKAQALAKTVNNTTVQIAQRVAQDDELFGSVGTKEIVSALAKAGVSVDGKMVHLTDRIRKLGRYAIEVSLHKTVKVTVNVEVVNSDPNAPSLADTLAAVAAKKAEREAAKKAEKEAKASGVAPAEGEAKDEKAEKSEKAEKPEKSEKSDKKPAAKADKAEGKKGDDKPAKGKAADKKKG